MNRRVAGTFSQNRFFDEVTEPLMGVNEDAFGTPPGPYVAWVTKYNHSTIAVAGELCISWNPSHIVFFCLTKHKFRMHAMRGYGQIVSSVVVASRPHIEQIICMICSHYMIY